MTRGDEYSIQKSGQDVLQRYVCGEIHLSRTVCFFNRLRELGDIASKINLALNLDCIARRAGSLRPRTWLLMSPSHPDYNEILGIDSIVIKRIDNNEHQRHVLMPGDARRSKSYLQAHTHGSRPQWLVNEYVPTLALGKWRTVVIGGKIQYTIFTATEGENVVSAHVVSEFSTLDELR